MSSLLTGRWIPAGFGRSVAVLATGTAAGQAITVMAAPLLSRLYTPDEFGAFGVFLAIVSLAAVGVALRYEAAIPLPDSDDEAADVLVLSFLVIAGTSIVIGLAVWFVVSYIAVDVIPSTMRSMLWLLPIVLFLTGLYQTLTFWATRTQAFSTSARAGVAQSATQTASQLVLGLAGGGVVGISVGYMIGRAGGVAAFLPAIRPAHRAMLRGVSASRLRIAADRYRRFPQIALWASLMNSASFQVPVLLLAALFDATVVGWFLLTVRVLQLPLTLVGSAVGQVFYARASRSSQDDLRSTTTTVFRSLVVLGTGPMVLLAIGGEQAFALVFGDDWREAGKYAQWLAPWLLLVFIASPMSTLVFVLSRQRGELIFQLSLFGTRIGALLAGWQLGGATAAVALFGVTGAVLWAIYMGWLLELGGAGIRDSLSRLARELAFATLLAAPVLAANLFGIQGIAWAAVTLTVLGIMVVRAARQVQAAGR